ncbi:MAG: 4Fe-4S binding protein [Synergistaceae bacterium]|jgi:2-oxoglutarate ferredoxin oxidoreductase subunit delta|nr:4Fe-4S binding protein [Synergistaceae bacterium]
MANRVTIFENVCKGCGLCTLVCPKKIMKIDKNRFNDKGYNPSAVTDISQCIACAMCAAMCPDSAIKVEKE